MENQKCPVCNGNGLVSGGFYTHPGDCPYWISNQVMECCRTCGGKGWVEVEDIAQDQEPDMRLKIRLQRLEKQLLNERKAGIEEVIEWIHQNATPVIADPDKVLLKFLAGSQPNALLLSATDWRARIKEWGWGIW